jgi:glycosyltransferase involved in cell wall biosynthesis
VRAVTGKIAIFIPAHNEEKTIASVVILAKKYGKVFVVDDGSADKTAEIARLAGAQVLARKANGGYGAAIKTALESARGLDAAAFVFLDADMQHDPGEIPSVAAPVLAREADACLGSRFLGKAIGAPLGRTEGVRLVNRLSRLREGGEKLDFECGFRAFSKKAVGQLEIKQDGYEACSEAIVFCLKHGLTVSQAPVTVRYFENGGSALAHGAGLLGHILNAVARRKPLLFFAGSGLAMLLCSALLGLFVANTYYSTHNLAIGSAMLTVFTGIIGLVLLSIGINIYTLETLLEQRKGGGA